MKLKELTSKVEQLKEITGEEFKLDHNQAGYKVYLMDNKAGGVLLDNVITSERLTARETWRAINTFLNGFLFLETMNRLK